MTAVDVAQVALDRAAEHAHRSDLTGRIRWQRNNLAQAFPDGTYDLVSAQFPALADRVSPRAGPATRHPNDRARGRPARVGHAGFPPWAHDPDPTVHFPTPLEVADSLDLSADGWTTEVSDSREREATGPDGQLATLVATVVMVRRLA